MGSTRVPKVGAVGSFFAFKIILNKNLVNLYKLVWYFVIYCYIYLFLSSFDVFWQALQLAATSMNSNNQGHFIHHFPDIFSYIISKINHILNLFWIMKIYIFLYYIRPLNASKYWLHRLLIDFLWMDILYTTHFFKGFVNCKNYWSNVDFIN